MNVTMPETELEGDAEQMNRKTLKRDLRNSMNNVEELLKKAASDQPREWMRAVQSKARKSLRAANDWMTEEGEAAIARTQSAVKATEDYARANTWMILGMAAIAGLVVGTLAVRRGLSFIEKGKSLSLQGKRAIPDLGKEPRETVEKD